MYQRNVWCYIFVLTFLDLSLNSILSAHGKSDDVVHHDSHIEEISVQEWGAAGSADVALIPPTLDFGPAELGVAHSRTVTVLNRGNATLHLASVAGTSPDLHASFFDSKTLAPNMNTTFRVVYVGRYEGPLAAHLYIHTSRGVHKYPVSAEGVASEWDIWPLVDVRVPDNATVEPVLSMYNPTDSPVQIGEIYSSAGWLGLKLVGSGGASDWLVAPHSHQQLVRLVLPARSPAAAYVRLRSRRHHGVFREWVVSVEVSRVQAGVYSVEPQIHVKTHSLNKEEQVEIYLGNSGSVPASLHARHYTATCSAQPIHPHANGGTTSGVTSQVPVEVVTSSLDPHSRPILSHVLKLPPAALYASVASPSFSPPKVWCRVSHSHSSPQCMLTVHKAHVQVSPIIIRTSVDPTGWREVVVRNPNQQQSLVQQISFPEQVKEHFEVQALTPLWVPARGAVAAARLRLRAAPAPGWALAAAAELRANHTRYALPLAAHAASLPTEWLWLTATESHLPLGAVGAGSTLRVRARVVNPSSEVLCATKVQIDLAFAKLEWDGCSGQTNTHTCACVSPHSHMYATLVVRAPDVLYEAYRGTITIWTEYSHTTQSVSLHVHRGTVSVAPVHVPPVAPYIDTLMPLVLESTMSIRMQILGIHFDTPHPGLTYVAPPEEELRWISMGSHTVGMLRYRAEESCWPHCYILDPAAEGKSWLQRSGESALEEDSQVLADKIALFRAASEKQIQLYVTTSQVVRIPVSLRLRAHWPCIHVSGHGATASLVATPTALNLRIRVPHALRMEMILTHTRYTNSICMTEASICKTHRCTPNPHVFKFVEFTPIVGNVTIVDNEEGDEMKSPPTLIMGDNAEVEVKMHFTPPSTEYYTAYLILRNNLTVYDVIQLAGRGETPQLEVDGVMAGSHTPIVFHVRECPSQSPTAIPTGIVTRRLTVRNLSNATVGGLPWSVGGGGCVARGWRLVPCDCDALPSNHSAVLTVSFAPDWGQARVNTVLETKVGKHTAKFLLMGVVPRCVPAAPAWDGVVRAAGRLVVLAALAVVIPAAAIDAERILRAARRARAALPRAPLDLRNTATNHVTTNSNAVPNHTPPPAAPQITRRRRARRPPAPLDPAAEKHAFERWRADVLARAERRDTRSSDDTDSTPPPPKPPTPRPPSPASSSTEDVASLESTSSSPVEEPELEVLEPEPEPEPDVELEEPRPETPAPEPPPPIRSEPVIRRREPRQVTSVSSVTNVTSEVRSDIKSVRAPRISEVRAVARPHPRRRRAPPPPRAAPPPPVVSIPPVAPPTVTTTSSVAVGSSSSALVRGASWSEVVSGTSHDTHSLFYYGSDLYPPYRGAEEPPPPTTTSLGWGDSGWGSSWWEVRPPPGFPAPRAYDPFRSLAAIWAPPTPTTSTTTTTHTNTTSTAADWPPRRDE